MTTLSRGIRIGVAALPRLRSHDGADKTAQTQKRDSSEFPAPVPR